ncbi:MAG: ribose 5-phosphate isomerase B [Candidatus Omnitrophica bacterium]|nr:ribose 5-phosphate isomerase B [Candidatus Omnitrophota bacterium]
MKIVIGSDHRGVRLKTNLVDYLESKGHNVLDIGTDTEDSCDYPKFALKAARAVSRKEVERGILICNSGLGMTMAAGSVKGVRAANCLNLAMARFSREHNDANVLVVPAVFVKEALAKRIVNVWLKTEFAGGRHLRRIKMFAK